MKSLIPLVLLSVFMFNGCAKKYSYPNYEIIKPQKKCKPNRKNIEKLLTKHLNKPYVWAEEGPDAFDCSGLTYNIYGEMGILLPRVAKEQARVGKRVKQEDLIYGDLIFFGSTNPKSKRIYHVGIYLGEGWFAHASSKDRKVIYTNFNDEPKYIKRMKTCRRYMSKNEKKIYKQCDGKLSNFETTSTTWTTPWKTGMPLPARAVPR
jgi:hypothetical protein